MMSSPAFPYGLSLVLALIAGAAHADVGDRADLARAALASGNERVAIYVASDPEMPVEMRLEAGQLSGAYGYTVDGQPQRVAGNLTWAPILSYDPNINGGSLKDGFTVSGFDFAIPEDQRRKSGIVVGGQADAFVRYATGRQSVVDLSTNVSLVWAPQHDMIKASISGSGCLTRQVERDLYLSGCVVAAVSETDLNSEAFGAGRVSANKIFDWGRSVHDVKVSVSANTIYDRAARDGYTQNRAEISGTALTPEGGLFGYSLMHGERVEGRKVRTQSYAGFKRFDTFVGPVTIGAEYSVYEGARWLGRDVDEDTRTVFVEFPVRDRFAVRAELSDTRSGSALNDGRQISVSIDTHF